MTGSLRYGWIIAASLICVMMPGCAAKVPLDPITVATDKAKPPTQRVDALRQVWGDVRSGKLPANAVRPETKTIAWISSNPQQLRLVAFEELLRDPTPEALDDTRGMIRLRLPREPDDAIVEALGHVVVERRWEDCTPALVRRWSLIKPGVADVDRAEARTLAKLYPGKEFKDIVADVFLNPPTDEAKWGTDAARRARLDAWDVLDRLDASGEYRRELIEQRPAEGPSAAVLATLKDALKDLRITPRTGEELDWLVELRRSKSAAETAWWKNAAAAIAAAPQAASEGLRLRHLEAVRWAAAHKHEWMGWDRSRLVAELASRIGPREKYARRARDRDGFAPKPIDDRFETWKDGLTWSDAIVMLVVDEALQQASVRAALFQQAQADQEDTTTEYGGALMAASAENPASSADASFRAVSFPPRPGMREGDRSFVASADMLAQTRIALAHFHFHVQEARNAEYAGPSGQDLLYAARAGRTCAVFTSVRDGGMDADVYQPDGATVDLGEITKPD